MTHLIFDRQKYGYSKRAFDMLYNDPNSNSQKSFLSKITVLQKNHPFMFTVIMTIRATVIIGDCTISGRDKISTFWVRNRILVMAAVNVFLSILNFKKRFK